MKGFYFTVFILFKSIFLSLSSIDTRQVIVRRAPLVSSQPDALFGYSIALYLDGPPGAGPNQDVLNRARVVVSAPRLTVPGGQVQHTGAIYTCPVIPGPCAGLTTNSQLYDSTANSAGDEDKEGQFLGGSMATNNHGIVICAHRYRRVQQNNATNAKVYGRCFASPTDNLYSTLSVFKELVPCTRNEVNDISATYCQAGTSSVLTRFSILALGLPGYQDSRGAIVRYTGSSLVNLNVTFSGTDAEYSYRGYAMATGRFEIIAREDFAVAAPRQNNYFGTVRIVSNLDNLAPTTQAVLQGQQMGEYFGFSLLSADLNGDDYDELFVSAPLYRRSRRDPEVGRVYLYQKGGGGLQLHSHLEGFSSYSRFGYAMANLGDISGDGFDDVAISAPFSATGESESGTVYIYHSSLGRLLSTTPSQIIKGSSLPFSVMSAISGLKGFGTSLASGIDVDGNTMNDLAIGAFESQHVFVLRTRPIARVTSSIAAMPQIVRLQDKTCTIATESFACLSIITCHTYSGSGLSSSLNVTLTLRGDVRSGTSRVFFAGMTSSYMEQIVLSISNQMCINTTAYIQNNIFDTFSPFVFEADLLLTDGTIPIGDGNEVPIDLSIYPVLLQTGVKSVQVETFKNCSGSVCIPDLRIAVDKYTAQTTNGATVESSTIVLGRTRSVRVDTRVRNAGNDAYQATILIDVPTKYLRIGQVLGLFEGQRNPQSLVCGDSRQVKDGSTQSTQVSCVLGNPLRQDASLIVQTNVFPTAAIVVDLELTVAFLLSSVNEEDPLTINDFSNVVSGFLDVTAMADITLDSPGLVSPEQVSYATNRGSVGSPQSISDLGSPFSVSFVVRNSGPSTIARADLIIMWPLRRTGATDEYYLYPTRISTGGTTGATVSCSTQNINPLGLSSQQGGGNNRNKRSAHSSSSANSYLERQRRQTAAAVTSERTLSCAFASPVLECVPIQCTISGFQGRNAQVKVDVGGNIDERYFSPTHDRFTLIITADVKLPRGAPIVQPNPDVGKNSTAQLRVIPAVVIPPAGRTLPIPWWVILLSILAALAVIVGVSLLLWFLGFFKRQKHEELKQRKEELKNLEESGVTPGQSGEESGPGGADEDNLITE